MTSLIDQEVFNLVGMPVIAITAALVLMWVPRSRPDDPGPIELVLVLAAPTVIATTLMLYFIAHRWTS